MKIQLRNGTAYSLTGVVDFLEPVLDEYQNNFKTIKSYLPGDVGYATPG